MQKGSEVRPITRVSPEPHSAELPIAKGAEIFAERWTPLIIRNLHVGAHTFGEIAAGGPRISSTLLAQRLQGLERAGVMERRPNSLAKGRYST